MFIGCLCSTIGSRTAMSSPFQFSAVEIANLHDRATRLVARRCPQYRHSRRALLFDRRSPAPRQLRPLARRRQRPRSPCHRPRDRRGQTRHRCSEPAPQRPRRTMRRPAHRSLARLRPSQSCGRAQLRIPRPHDRPPLHPRPQNLPHPRRKSTDPTRRPAIRTATASASPSSPSNAATWSPVSASSGPMFSTVSADSRSTASSRCTTTPPSTPPSTRLKNEDRPPPALPARFSLDFRSSFASRFLLTVP